MAKKSVHELCDEIYDYIEGRDGQYDGNMPAFQALSTITGIWKHEVLSLLALLHHHYNPSAKLFAVLHVKFNDITSDYGELYDFLYELNIKRFICCDPAGLFDDPVTMDEIVMIKPGSRYINEFLPDKKGEETPDNSRKKASDESSDSFDDDMNFLCLGHLSTYDGTVIECRKACDPKNPDALTTFETNLGYASSNPLYKGWFSETIQSLSEDEKIEILDMVATYLESGFVLSKEILKCKSLMTKGLVTQVAITAKGIEMPNKAFLPSASLARLLLRGFPVKNIGFLADFISYVPWKEIVQKPLFYNDDIMPSINTIKRICDKAQYPRIADRMEKKGQQSGITALLYGGPGTGKTEFARQIARESERDICICEYSKLSSPWVGEAPRQAKLLFTGWSLLEAVSEHCPILLLNEADSLLQKRLSNIQRGWETELNAIQNEWLDFFEHFRGIMLCTTNCIQNLDSAFDRRFFIKCEVPRPDEVNRRKMWLASKPDYISEELVETLCRYDLSCANIENVIKRLDIQAMIFDESPSEEDIIREVTNECDVLSGKKDRPAKVGFNL